MVPVVDSVCKVLFDSEVKQQQVVSKSQAWSLQTLVYIVGISGLEVVSIDEIGICWIKQLLRKVGVI